MPGHLFEVTLIDGNKYNIVTKSNNEEAAREAYRRSLGSRNEIYTCLYIEFMHVVET